MDEVFELELAAERLSKSEGYKVLRRVDVSDLEDRDVDLGDYTVGLVVDCETTGLDRKRDKIIELAARLFWATAEGEIIAVGPSMSWLEDPGEPLEPVVAEITGLASWDLYGHKIDDEAVSNLVSRADFIVAHNASFDRPMVTRRLPVVDQLPWCCSCRDVDWGAFDFEGRSLGWLLAQNGRFYSAHRAAADVDATIELLRQKLFHGQSVLAYALRRARQTTTLISAFGAHIGTKDSLRLRGYRWDGDDRIWRKETDEGEVEKELRWLDENVYAPGFGSMASEPSLREVTWLTRYA